MIEFLDCWKMCCTHIDRVVDEDSIVSRFSKLAWRVCPNSAGRFQLYHFSSPSCAIFTTFTTSSNVRKVLRKDHRS